METNDSYVELSRELFEQLARMRRGMHPSARNSMRGEMAVIRALHLAAVAGEADPTPSQIAKRSHLSPARVANVLRSLEEKGLVTREHSQADRRRVTVSLTEAGRAEDKRHKEEFEELASDFLAQLGEKDTREMLRILRRVNQTIDGNRVARQAADKQDQERKGGQPHENHQAF